jgi:thiol-disulfide isomerase/thioredoxin
MIELKDKDFHVIGGKIAVRHKDFKGKQGLVMFKTDWCGYCQRAKPEFEEASDILGSSFPIGIIDCDSNKLATKAAGVVGYPTIKFCDNKGKLTDNYAAERTTGSILKTVCEKAKKCPRK